MLLFTFLISMSIVLILDLIESSGHLGIEEYHGLVNKFNELLIENGLQMLSVHAEMITSTLIRDKYTRQRLDFSGTQVDEYDIYRVSKAVLNGPLSVSLAFERLDEQLTDLKTYEKQEESLMDFLFH